MFDLLLSFVKTYHKQLLKIYIEEMEKNGPGALVVLQEKGNAEVSFRTPDKLPYPELKKEMEEKMEVLKQNQDENMKVNNKWIVTLSSLEPGDVSQTPMWYIILDEGDDQVLFQGFPQLVEIQGKHVAQYVLIAEPHQLNEKKYHWTVEGTTQGQQYLASCNASVKNEMAYLVFRSNAKYANILISGVKWHGEKYLERVQNELPELLDKLDDFRKNDSVGSPQVFKYGEHGNFSPQTLRYMNTLLELKQKFGKMNNWSIVELGGGYGGLCHTIFCDVPYRKYTFYEVPPAVKLAQKVLEELKVKRVTFREPEDFDDSEIHDLFISEYTLSEFDEEGIELYLNRLVRRCKNVYLNMNIWDQEKKNTTLEKFKEFFEEIEEYETYPKTEWPNYVWVCKNNKVLRSINS
jgi:putative sugar O-methyltransferase